MTLDERNKALSKTITMLIDDIKVMCGDDYFNAILMRRKWKRILSDADKINELLKINKN